MIALLAVEIPPYVIALAISLTLLTYLCTLLIIVLTLYSWSKSTQHHITKFSEQLSNKASKLSLNNLYKHELANIKVKVQAKLKATYERSLHTRYVRWNEDRLDYNHVFCDNKINSNVAVGPTESDHDNCCKSKWQNCVNTKGCNECPTSLFQVREVLQNKQLQPETESINTNLAERVVAHIENDEKTTSEQCTITNKTNLSVKPIVVNKTTHTNCNGANDKAKVDEDDVNLFNWEGTENVSEFNYNYINEVRPFLLPAITTPVVASLSAAHTFARTTLAKNKKASSSTNNNYNNNNDDDDGIEYEYMVQDKKHTPFTELPNNGSEMDEASVVVTQTKANKPKNTFVVGRIALSQNASFINFNSHRFASSSSSMSVHNTIVTNEQNVSESNSTHTMNMIDLEVHTDDTAAYEKSTCMSSLCNNHSSYCDVSDNDHNESKLELTSTAVVTSDTNSLSNDEYSDHTTNDKKAGSSIEENEVDDEVKDVNDGAEQLQVHKLCTVHTCNTEQVHDLKFCSNYNREREPYINSHKILEDRTQSATSPYVTSTNARSTFNAVQFTGLKVQAH